MCMLCCIFVYVSVCVCVTHTYIYYIIYIIYIHIRIHIQYLYILPLETPFSCDFFSLQVGGPLEGGGHSAAAFSQPAWGLPGDRGFFFLGMMNLGLPELWIL